MRQVRCCSYLLSSAASGVCMNFTSANERSYIGMRTVMSPNDFCDMYHETLFTPSCDLAGSRQ